MELPGVDVKMVTTCNPYPVCLGTPGSTFFKPDENFFLALPEARHVVINPLARIPAGFSMSTSAQKCVTVMEVPANHDLNAKIRTNSPSGSLILEDVRYTGQHREVVSDVALNYELRANAEVSISRHGDTNQLNVNFKFEFQCWLSGSMTASAAPCTHEAPSVSHGSETCASQASPCDKPDSQARQPKTYAPSSLRLSYSSSKAMHVLDTTNEELSCLETKVEHISSMLSNAGQSDICSLKSELAQLETRAKQLETKVIDDVYTGELQTGRQLAKDAKKDMLSRLERLFEKLDATFLAMRAKTL